MASPKLFKQLKAKPPRDLDAVVHDLHDQAFTKIDCLDCANCCKTTGPLWTDRDRERVAKHIGMKTGAFEAQYLRVDEDQDWVLQTLPCPFLGTDNYCSIYDVRPKACREYPHTDRVKQHQILGLMEKNAAICPAVEHIVKKMEALYLTAGPSAESGKRSKRPRRSR
jgi:Fe-S-cluster containining protein